METVKQNQTIHGNSKTKPEKGWLSGVMGEAGKKE